MKIFYHQYELHPHSSLSAIAAAGPRRGALLKFQWSDGMVGYGDCFPWPELNDHDIDDQLRELSHFKLSRLVEQSMWLARRDAVARKSGMNLFRSLPKIKNHFLINDFTKVKPLDLKTLRESGFGTLKLKVGRQIDEESKWVSRIIEQYGFFFRLDFNSLGDFSRFERFISPINVAIRSRIEFVEDPFPFDLDSWKEASKLARIAADNESEKKNLLELSKPPFQILVIKPARVDVEKAVAFCEKNNIKFVITSSMDHLVGNLHALSVAGELSTKALYLGSGCLSLSSYIPNEFNKQITTQGPYLIKTIGTGIGFDSLFSKMEWLPIQEFGKKF